jgi:hypothetical protein
MQSSRSSSTFPLPAVHRGRGLERRAGRIRPGSGNARHVEPVSWLAGLDVPEGEARIVAAGLSSASEMEVPARHPERVL